jgi:hypothetical protein
MAREAQQFVQFWVHVAAVASPTRFALRHSSYLHLQTITANWFYRWRQQTTPGGFWRKPAASKPARKNDTFTTITPELHDTWFWFWFVWRQVGDRSCWFRLRLSLRVVAYVLN